MFGMMGADASQRWQEYVEQLQAAGAEGRRGAAVELFMRLAGASEQNIVRARNTDRFAQVRQPTLVVTGGRDDLFERAADAIDARLRQAERERLEGQGHVVDPKALAPLLARFLKS